MDEQAPEKTSDNGDQDITTEYANNVWFGPTVWDLKLVFGELAPALLKKGVIDWHTAITLPWAQAKLMSYYLQLNVEVHELQNGVIKIPSMMLPPGPEIPKTSDPGEKAVFELINEHRKRFLGRMG
jgi:hypothetical protein